MGDTGHFVLLEHLQRSIDEYDEMEAFMNDDIQEAVLATKLSCHTDEAVIATKLSCQKTKQNDDDEMETIMHDGIEERTGKAPPAASVCAQVGKQIKRQRA